MAALPKPACALIAAAVLCLGGFAFGQKPLAIVEQVLPTLDAGVEVRIPLHVTGGIPPYHWRVVAGDLPQGIGLTTDGVLFGRPTKPGAVAVTIMVEDSGQPAHSITKDFQTLVSAPLLLNWLRFPQVHGNHVEGAVQVSNGSKDDFDLTVIIMAINTIGRATALAYQHITLKAGATNLAIPFSETLPPGAYVIHSDAVAEIPAKNSILRQRLQTPVPLAVTLGP